MDNYETGIYTDNPDDTLRYMKSAEVVEVVRCKDCNYSKEYSDKQFTCKWFDTIVFPDDFCSNGERRSEGVTLEKISKMRSWTDTTTEMLKSCVVRIVSIGMMFRLRTKDKTMSAI